LIPARLPISLIGEYCPFVAPDVVSGIV